MRIHQIKSWEVIKTGGYWGTVYSQRIAVDKLAEPDTKEIKLAIQERVCVSDRPDYNETEDGECYMCKREREGTEGE